MHALGVLLDAEQTHLSVDATEGLLALEDFLSVVQAACCHVQIDGLVGADLNLAPFAITECAAHIVVSFHVGER